MQELIVTEGESLQRLDKYLRRKLPAAPSSFLYRMLRKKNITLNGRKAEGSEKVAAGDRVCFYLSDETFAGFGGRTGAESGDASGVSLTEAAKAPKRLPQYREAYRTLGQRGAGMVVFENEHILLAHKQPGVLSQKAAPEDLSMNEWFVGYLLEKGEVTARSLQEFTPSVSNRLDRNTGGLLLCAKTLQGSRALSALQRDRRMRKFYLALVQGVIREGGELAGFLTKDRASNYVTASSVQGEGAWPVRTLYRPVRTGRTATLLECELVTGKTHQLRAQLSDAGHPIAGDPKYGNAEWNAALLLSHAVRGQLLYACRVEFPQMEGVLEPLSGRRFQIEPPAVFYEIMRDA